MNNLEVNFHLGKQIQESKIFPHFHTFGTFHLEFSVVCK